MVETDTQTILITGCSSGIGRATAETFNEAGWTVYATARNLEDITPLREQGCQTARLDVTIQDHVDTVIEEIIHDHGHLDCVVNNAGYGQYGSIEDVPLDAVKKQFEVNVFGSYRLLHTAVPFMRRQGSGTIINISSIAGRMGVPGMGVYSASKFAIEGISEALRGELQSAGVDVVCLEPGPVKTGFAERADNELVGIDQTDAYEGAYEMANTIKEGAREDAGELGIEPTEVAKAALEAANADNPDLQIPVGQYAKMMLE
jgi:NAD(P)-dependent dehydrogenase (short-subunit alcohol dehydrogenase family)